MGATAVISFGDKLVYFAAKYTNLSSKLITAVAPIGSFSCS